MRLVVIALALLACSEPQIALSPPAIPVFTLDTSPGVSLYGAACAIVRGRDVIYAPFDDAGDARSLIRATWSRAGWTNAPIYGADIGVINVFGCAASQGGRTAVVGVGRSGDELIIDGVVQRFPAASPSAVLWVDETRVLVGALATGTFTGSVRDDGTFSCSRSSSPLPLQVWDGAVASSLPIAAHVNRLDWIDWFDGHRVIFVSADCDPPRVLDESLREIALPQEMRSIVGAMGAASLTVGGQHAVYVSDVVHDHLYIDGHDVAGDWGIVEATSWHSGWNPVAVDLNGDGKQDLLVAQSIVEEDAAAFRQAIADGSASRAYDLALIQGEGRFYPVRFQHRLDGGDFYGCAVASGDVDGDGAQDAFFACASHGKGDLRLYFNRTNERTVP